ncbi:MAG: hypothetical protein AB1432_01590 [Bacteroidota bacterium]
MKQLQVIKLIAWMQGDYKPITEMEVIMLAFFRSIIQKIKTNGLKSQLIKVVNEYTNLEQWKKKP